MAIFYHSTLCWKDIENEILSCTFCGQRLQDPKLLPCLHRCCRSCLEIKIRRNGSSTINCPKCLYEMSIPDDGVDGFQNDVIVQDMYKLEEIRLNFRRRRNCCVCGRNRACRTYCFICDGYLCDNCHKIHRESTVYQEHQAALLPANDFVKGDIDPRIVFSKILLKCQEHPQNTASHCCTECDDKIVCHTCVAEKHRSHVMERIGDRVLRTKEDLSKSMSPLADHIHDVKSKQKRVDDIKETLGTTVNKKSQNLRRAYEDELAKITTTENFVAGEYDDQKSNLENNLKVDIESLQIALREEIDQLKEKYGKLIREKKKQAKYADEKLKESRKWEMDKFKEIKETLKNNFTEVMIEMGKEGHERRATLYEMRAYFDQIIQRYDNLTTAESIVMATGSDGIVISGTPAIFSATEALQEDVEREFPSLESLAEFPSYYLPEVNLTFDAKEEKDGYGCKDDILSADTETTEL